MKALLVAGAIAFASCGGAAPIPTPSPTIPDADNDGITDVDDLCPDAPETWNLWQDRDGCPDEAPKINRVDSRLGGTWHGTQEVTMDSDGGARMALPTTLLVTTDNGPEPSAFVTGLCPSGGGLLATHRVEQSIPMMAWNGTMECQPAPFPSCTDPHITYTAITGSLSPTGSIVIQGRGTWSGCGRMPTPFDMRFEGVH